ncbi:MAG TPA: nicotinate phosphoribosyltransferase [Armatimonadota bacterium]|nr:nicotinate phosphoribosyltransferase [Armatimonadota bacterium]
MSRFDGQRLPPATFGLDVDGLRSGVYSDRYFVNMQRIFERLAQKGAAAGDIEVEMQWFCRRKPAALVAGVDEALAMLRTCAGTMDPSGQLISSYDQLEVLAIHDGDIVSYHGDPSRVEPVLVVRGRYRDFVTLETPTLGALSRGSRIATNVYRVLEAAGGKPVLFFPARFDSHRTQSADGYAYWVAVQRYNHDHGARVRPFVSTDAQGAWWGGAGSGTVAHGYIGAFHGDTAAAMVAFAEECPLEVPRIALVDYHNDCVGDSLRVARALFERWAPCAEAGDAAGMARYELYAVRLDTSGDMLDLSLAANADPSARGVSPALVRAVRRGLDNAWSEWGLTGARRDAARDFCRAVRIVATGGFSVERIRAFESDGVPVDIYGVGSAVFDNSGATGTNTDFTADVVRVRQGGQWIDMAKAGRRACPNPLLERVH